MLVQEPEKDSADSYLSELERRLDELEKLLNKKKKGA